MLPASLSHGSFFVKFSFFGCDGGFPNCVRFLLSLCVSSGGEPDGGHCPFLPVVPTQTHADIHAAVEPRDFRPLAGVCYCIPFGKRAADASVFNILQIVFKVNDLFQWFLYISTIEMLNISKIDESPKGIPFEEARCGPDWQTRNCSGCCNPKQSRTAAADRAAKDPSAATCQKETRSIRKAEGNAFSFLRRAPLRAACNRPQRRPG
jgi:hypothetical protein